MEILGYKKCNGNLYEVKFDTGEKYKIYDDLILKYELLIEKKINEKKFLELIRENEMMSAYFKSIKYIDIKMRTEKEIEKYLKKNEFSRESIDYAIDKLKSEGYLNSELYVKSYINDAINLSLNGPKKIEDTLHKLGISEKIINKYLDEISEDVWNNRIREIINKKLKINKDSAIIFKKKTYSNLLMLGYDSSLINEILDEFSIDESSNFLKEADKVWNLLEKKYSQSELVLKFKNKMYSKGFNYEYINEYIDKKN